MNQHNRYKFSATIHTDVLAIVSSMRGLAQHCQVDGNKTIAWGGTKERDWQRNGRQVTFHFSSANYRDNFLLEAEKLFVGGGWKMIAQSDNNPATPQSLAA